MRFSGISLNFTPLANSNKAIYAISVLNADNPNLKPDEVSLNGLKIAQGQYYPYASILRDYAQQLKQLKPEDTQGLNTLKQLVTTGLRLFLTARQPNLGKGLAGHTQELAQSLFTQSKAGFHSLLTQPGASLEYDPTDKSFSIEGTLETTAL